MPSSLLLFFSSRGRDQQMHSAMKYAYCWDQLDGVVRII